MTSRVGRVASWLRERGALWTTLWLLRALAIRVHRRLLRSLEVRLAAIERRRFLLAPDTLSARRNTIEENRQRWTERDWSQLGEDWTEDVADTLGLDPQQWKRGIVERLLLPHAVKGGTLLEIGPGGGRWTAYLVELAGVLHLVDISPRCLALCRARFGDESIAYHAVDEGRLDFLEDASVDFIWSYDVFVHVNPTDCDLYLASFARVLRPGARAIIHHAGRYASDEERRDGFRSNLSAEFFLELCCRHGLRVLAQDFESPHKPGDCITTLERGDSL